MAMLKLPKDGPAFAPREGEELTFRRYRMVQTLLGGNVTLPSTLDEGSNEEESLDLDVDVEGRVLTPEEIIRRQREGEVTADQISDAFSPVRGLVSGSEAIVAEATYTYYRGVQARVISSVAAVQAAQPWVFLCLAGSEYGASRFVLLTAEGAEPITALEPACEELRCRLGPAVAQRPFDTTAAEQLSRYLHHLNEMEERMLPRKKQRALDEIRLLLNHLGVGRIGVGRKPRRGPKLQAALRLDARWREAAEAVWDLLNGPRVREGRDGWRVMVDLGVVADRWLSILRPAWLAVGRESRRKILLLKDLREHLRANPPSADDLELLLVEEGLWSQPLDERVVAAIVGVSEPG